MTYIGGRPWHAPQFIPHLKGPLLNLPEAVSLHRMRDRCPHKVVPSTKVVLVGDLLDTLVPELEPRARSGSWVYYWAHAVPVALRAPIALAADRVLPAVPMPRAIRNESGHEGELHDRSDSSLEEEIPRAIYGGEVVDARCNYDAHVIVEEPVVAHAAKAQLRTSFEQMRAPVAS